ncbi:unnamed protein product, partial [Brassica rapa]
MHVSLFKVPNPPPATLMLISDELEDTCPFISRCQQKRYYNLVLARTYTPPSMSCLYHTAEWLWQTLLARSQAITSYDLRKCTASGDSAWSFLCDACYFTYLSVTDFTRHLSSEEHKRRWSGSVKQGYLELDLLVRTFDFLSENSFCKRKQYVQKYLPIN